MLNKKIVPTEDNIKEFIGENAVKNAFLKGSCSETEVSEQL